MIYKTIVKIVCITLLTMSFNANAALISVDWKNSGDGLITRDTKTGLEWLDLTETVNRSYNDISLQLDAGGKFEGWIYATTSQIETYFDSAGGIGPYNGVSTTNNGIAKPLLDLWGDLQLPPFEANFITAAPYLGSQISQWVGRVSDNIPSFSTLDFMSAQSGNVFNDEAFNNLGSALVRNSIVPIPAAVWLFGSGILILVGFTRREKP